MKKERQYVRIDFDTLESMQSQASDKLYHLYPNGLLVFRNGQLFGKDKQCEKDEFYVIKPYLNKFYGSQKGYWKFQYKGLKRRYRILAECFKPIPAHLNHLTGTRYLTVDHIDKDSTNDDIDNLRWMSLSDNSKRATKTEEYKKKYSDGVRAAHAAGHYKKHLEKHLKELHGGKNEL